MNEKAGWKPAGHRSTAPRAGHRGALLQAFPKLLGGRCWVEIPLSLTTLGTQMSANAAGKMFIFTKDVNVHRKPGSEALSFSSPRGKGLPVLGPKRGVQRSEAGWAWRTR